MENQPLNLDTLRVDASRALNSVYAAIDNLCNVAANMSNKIQELEAAKAALEPKEESI